MLNLIPWKISQKSSAAAALVSTGLPALANQKYNVTAIRFYIAGANVGAAGDVALTIKDGTTVVWEGVFAPGQLRGGQLSFALSYPLVCSVNKELTFNAGAAGTGCIIGINAVGYID